MKYIEIKFKLTPDTDLARELLIAMAGEWGCDSFAEEEAYVTGYCLEDLFEEENIKQGIDNFILPDVEISYEAKKAEDKNWNEEWEKSGFKPIVINNRCVICGSNEENPLALLSENIDTPPLVVRIDPKQAFGSGSHETTQMIVTELLNTDLTDKTVLDCGCGTGILSIVAAKCGSKKVCGYDIDEWSVRNAIENASLNNVKLEIKEGNKQVINAFNSKFDIVIANINRNILLADMDRFAATLAAKGTLILSGFYKEDVELLEEKAATLQLEKCRLVENQQWCCLVFQRTQ
ncbi:50S ribosomal protein L11 methyltransferase [Prevotella ihumii]|uniref:50S ribosomal protein L11 methyltransferase n=1 Tax=Prevotella ihumii TaxID=1917878 RepID=UPI000980CF2B|nr:50S ribosomal protein L11 methyltransferase [Prevotella ihumii]